MYPTTLLVASRLCISQSSDGTQYFAVVSGIGGTYARQPDPDPAHVPKGGVVTAFKLLPQ